MALVRGGYTPLPHVQKFADDCERETGASNYGTYAGHDPTPQRALDIFHAVGDDGLPDKVCAFAIKNYKKYGVDYVISRQRIWNPEISTSWRAMADRGGVTQNHFDHVHVSFEPSAPVAVEKPKPVIDKERAMSLSVRYIYKDQTPGSVGNLDWVFDGPSRIFAPVGALGVLKACDACKFPELGVVDKDTHDWFSGVANGWRNQ